MSAQNTPITIARGDGIGPAIMDATLQVLEAAGARLDIEEIEIGKAVYESGVPSGIADSSWESLRRTKIFLKAPITTPQGGGFKSLNVTVRKTLGLSPMYVRVSPMRLMLKRITMIWIWLSYGRMKKTFMVGLSTASHNKSWRH